MIRTKNPLAIYRSAIALLVLVVGCTGAPTPLSEPKPIAPTFTPATGGTAVTAMPTAGVALTLTPTPAVTASPSSGAPPTALRLVGYFFGSDRNNRVSDIAAAQLTHVIYAFADVSNTGECVSMEPALDQVNLPQLQQLKRRNLQLKTMISIGGYSHSGNFSNAALTPDSRYHFAQSCIQFMRENGFDGIDIDWELPVSGGKVGNVHRPEDKLNFTALLAEFRSQLDALGASDNRHYLLTIAGPAGPSEYAHIELGAVQQYLDWVNLETYAYYTASSPLTNFNSPLYPSSADPGPSQKRLYDNGDAAARGYLAAGMPARKILLGVPFYGRGWKGVSNVNQSLYQQDAGPATDSGVPKSAWNDGAIEYGALLEYYLGSYPRYWHNEAKEPWLYNASTGIMITYEDPQSLGVKADYVRTQSLGGVMIWHLSADDAQHSLLNAVYSHLHP
jgi:chitinase